MTMLIKLWSFLIWLGAESQNLMPCVSMFSRFKAGCSSQTLYEGNAITTYFEIGRQSATAGPGLLWKIYDAYRKSDGKVNKQTTTTKYSAQ